jgi:hypothetical protein
MIGRVNWVVHPSNLAASRVMISVLRRRNWAVSEHGSIRRQATVLLVRLLFAAEFFIGRREFFAG